MCACTGANLSVHVDECVVCVGVLEIGVQPTQYPHGAKRNVHCDTRGRTGDLQDTSAAL